MTTPPPLIRMVHVRTQFGASLVHEDLNLDIFPGEIVALIGGSGSGKTTMLRQILGLAQPNAGSISVFGVDITQADRHAAPEDRAGRLHARFF